MDPSIAGLLLAFGLVLIMLTGIPVAVAFGLVNLVAAWLIFGSVDALSFLVQASFSSIANINLTAVPFFILMGAIFVRTGLSSIIYDGVARMLSGVRASGSYMAVGNGVVFGALMGASVAATAVLGSTMLNELRSRGYSKALSVGPILGSGTLDNLIPPSIGMVLIGTLAGLSIGDLLIAGLGPAFLIVGLFCAYIFVLARRTHTEGDAGTRETLRGRLMGLLSLAPLLIPIFFVTGVIYLGIATPTEASVTGSAATFAVALAYRRVTWKVLKQVLVETTVTTSMLLLIIASSKAYSQILAMSGITSAVVGLLGGYSLSQAAVVAIIIVMVLVLGCFMDQSSVIFVSIPLFIKVVDAMQIDPIWFGVMFSMAVGIGGITPPFGLNLFVLKGVAPKDISMRDIYVHAMPFVVIEIFAIGVVLFVPAVATFLVK